MWYSICSHLTAWYVMCGYYLSCLKHIDFPKHHPFAVLSRLHWSIKALPEKKKHPGEATYHVVQTNVAAFPALQVKAVSCYGDLQCDFSGINIAHTGEVENIPNQKGQTKTTNPKVWLPSWLEILWRTEGVWKMLGMSNHSNCAHVHSTLGHLLCEKDLPNYNPNMTKKDQIIISKNSLPISTFLLVLFSSPRTSSSLMPVKPKMNQPLPMVHL